MLTLLRLPFLPVPELADGLRYPPARPLFFHNQRKAPPRLAQGGAFGRNQDSKAVWQPRGSQIGI
jgi:hypothetical protein